MDCDQGLAFINNQNFEWNVPSEAGSNFEILYDVMGSPNPSNFTISYDCIESDDGPNTAVEDTAMPAIGHAYYYLVRPETLCGVGSLGVTSDGVPRVGPLCP